MPKDHYKTLGVRRTASQDEVLRAYRQAARRCHPDLHPHDRNATRKFYQVQAAFEVLGDPDKRRAYNRSQMPRQTARPTRFDSADWQAAREASLSLTRYATAEVTEPALGLAIACSLAVGLQYVAFFETLLRIDGGVVYRPVILSGTLGLLINLAGCVLGVLVLLGAIQMRRLENYRLAVSASLIAVFSCFSPWFLLVVPFGIWALVVLCKRRVRSAFWS